MAHIQPEVLSPASSAAHRHRFCVVRAVRIRRLRRVPFPDSQRLDWKHVILLFSTPIIALYGAMTWTFDWRTFAFAVFYYFVTGLGITAGYHRHL